MENKNDFEGFQICKKEFNCEYWPNEDNFVLDLHKEFHLDDLEEIKMERIDIKEETEDHLRIESLENYQYMYYQFCKQEEFNDENYFHGFIPENENGQNSQIISFKDNLEDKNCSYENSSMLIKENKSELRERRYKARVNVKPLGPIKKYKRINCGECENCLKPNCRACIYCKDKFLKINRLKQRCVQRKCCKFKLCGAAKCYICGSKLLKNIFSSIEDQSESIYSLMECSLCFRIAHMYCQENLCNGRMGKVLSTVNKNNFWQCPECVPFVGEDLPFIDKKQKTLSKNVHYEVTKNLVSKRQHKKGAKFSQFNTTQRKLKIEKGNQLFNTSKSETYKNFRSITGRRPWTGYNVFMSMSYKMLEKQTKSESSRSFVEARGVEWQKLPERKKIVFREGATKINLLLLRNAKNVPKIQKSSVAKKKVCKYIKKSNKASFVKPMVKTEENVDLENDSVRRFQCPKCEIIFNERLKFTEHFRTVHRNVKRKKIQPEKS